MIQAVPSEFFETSGLSRLQVASLVPDPTLCGFHDDCASKGSASCEDEHHHCFVTNTTLPWSIEVYRDIPRLPSLDVLLDLQQQLNIFHETRPVQSVFPAIQRIGNGREIFTAADVTLMISLSEYISKVSRKVSMEREMLARSKESGSIPVGQASLADSSGLTSFFNSLWHSPIHSNRLEIPYMEEDDPRTSQAVYEAEKALSSRVLDTESLSDLAVSSGELSSQMANYFTAKIQNLIPDSMFIYVDYTLQSIEARETQALSLQMDHNCLGWTVLLMNRGPESVNHPLIGYHWVVCLFSPEGQCFYGDPLNCVKIPANLPETLNPYFKARFGRELDYIFNCSIEANFPNFPKQLSDAHCCGYVCLLVMMLAKEPKLVEFILSPKTILGGPRFLKYPGYYPEFLKQLLQVTRTKL